MKTILTIGASTSKKSINRDFVMYVGCQIENTNSLNIDVSTFNHLPIFSVDYEAEFGAPKEIIDLHHKMKSVDGFVISFAEHNGSYSAGYKNIIDWISRQDGKIFNDKPTLLLSTSPGGRGGATVLSAAVQSYPHLGAKVVESFSLPTFYDNFVSNKLSNQEFLNQLNIKIKAFKDSL